MAFRFTTTKELEYRGVQAGTSSQTGKPWVSLIFEELSDANQLSISVPQDLQGDVYSLQLRKGDVCMVSFLAVARADGGNYLQLSAIPELCDEEED